MLILHGENEVASRQQLAEKILTAKLAGSQISRYTASNLSLGTLESALSAQPLFAQDELLIIEELHSLPRSAKKTALLQLLTAYQQDERVVLWEKKTLTNAQLKLFSKAQAQVFKTSSAVFAWLDSLGSSNQLARQLELLHKALATDGAELCFLMLARQVRLLIQVKSGTSVSGPPFVQQKLKRQTHQFDMQRLVQTHHQLLSVDLSQKTGSSPFTLEQELDLLLINLYST